MGVVTKCDLISVVIEIAECSNCAVKNAVRKAWCRPRPLLRILLTVALAIFSFALQARAQALGTSVYMYEDTRRLVSLVSDAATLMARKGEAAFAQFRVPNSHWMYGDCYVFIYTVDGTCVFQPEEPTLVGKNLIEMRDIAGRPIVRGITDVARRPEPDASGWVFYLWEDLPRLSPSWKATYIRKVVTPDHKVYALGAGLYHPKTERVFVKDNVDKAVQLLSQVGQAGMERLHDPSFTVLDSYIFVMDAHGRFLLDPVFPTLEPRDKWAFTDAVGVPVIQKVLQRLSGQEDVWMTYLEAEPGGRTPSRKAIYVRKIRLGGETLYVGSDFFLPAPVWMKVENESRCHRDPPT